MKWLFQLVPITGGHMAIRINLSKDELQALEKLAWRERRRVETQAALIVRRELERAGLLPAVVPTPTETEPLEVQHVQQ
jgi:hypothetical protein